ncbi:hypothetical protein MJO28_003534 [Puccinia striiformis f. sp. tritici]|uniref:Secreted protein n=3 Tax=Puccinia striiformis TaxID=27350 RepID=A0A0L0V3F4_9BASI|nr:hypothetical protein Pst134EA_007880 [Puccinia striiformis f. sp. tritici]KAI9625047.1 hypothetical protein KEM48_008590 [Puccinia striiformis f. sp. tritici PST-130]KNE93484.1 hypothetical protein PSTG_13114 [Puccinia striiformis f. sp. tritici PST-78]POV98361.1 hypothetical protein PSTT_14465 [Puccinia striiformis]KAH9460772.1 hypothetical protein Pst134EB_008931 [Puccinia striiformis f. sp. tritici]KAH9470636.1 hypothetical protein Pst134EA_007880 [Puccinia striiformis f. sp. tritici]
MFSGKFITALVLVFIAINVVDAKHKAPTSPKTKDPKGMRSQCSQWRAKGPPSTAKPPVMAKLMSAATQKPDAQTGGLQRRNTPPHQTGIEIGGGPSSVCNPNGGYNSTTTLGTCLWTGERQYPAFTDTKYYMGWVNYDHPANCYRKLWLNPAKGDPVYAPVLDGCAFAEKDQTISVDDGCATVWVTDLLFKKLGGKEGDKTVIISSWDYDYNNDGPGN